MKTTPSANRLITRKVIPALLLVCGLTQVAVATDVTVDATADFLEAIVLTTTNSITFTSGSGAAAITYDSSQDPSTDKLHLGTDGSLVVVGTHLVAPGSGSTAGVVTIAGTTGQAVNISCSANATLTNLTGHTHTLSLDEVEFKMNSGAAYGTGSTVCAGVGTSPLSYTILTGGGATNEILIGGELLAATTMVPENYSTANGGTAAPVTFEVVYQ